MLLLPKRYLIRVGTLLGSAALLCWLHWYAVQHHSDNEESGTLIVEQPQQEQLDLQSQQDQQQTFTRSPLEQIEVDEALKYVMYTTPVSSQDTIGEMGQPAMLNDDHLSPIAIQQRVDLFSRYKFDAFVSSRISLLRNLQDVRDPQCRTKSHPEKLPNTSVIIVFHNEAWSTLLRTVHSVLQRSPAHLLLEVILVDDASTYEHLTHLLDEYVEKLEKVRIIRSPKRGGIVQARLLGAEYAQGEVLTFLDSHCECFQGWLEPLLARIGEEPHVVATPVIHAIDPHTFQLPQDTPNKISVGGFDWTLSFVWKEPSSQDLEERRSSTGPMRSPTIAGEVFSVNRRYFDSIGSYDPDMKMWGGENLELSFRVWMCGGRLETLPCSHVGHLSRSSDPDSFNKIQLLTNLQRMALVWMDEYKDIPLKLYGESITELADNELIVSSRLALRRRLDCKSFRWYLDNVFPEQFDPYRALFVGEVKSVSKNMSCLHENGTSVLLEKCHGLGYNQIWFYSSDNELRQTVNCLTARGETSVTMEPCGQKNFQKWTVKGLHIVHSRSAMCLSAPDSSALKLSLSTCSESNTLLHWQLQRHHIMKSAYFQTSSLIGVE